MKGEWAVWVLAALAFVAGLRSDLFSALLGAAIWYVIGMLLLVAWRKVALRRAARRADAGGS